MPQDMDSGGFFVAVLEMVEVEAEADGEISATSEQYTVDHLEESETVSTVSLETSDKTWQKLGYNPHQLEAGTGLGKVKTDRKEKDKDKKSDNNKNNEGQQGKNKKRERERKAVGGRSEQEELHPIYAPSEESNLDKFGFACDTGPNTGPIASESNDNDDSDDDKPTKIRGLHVLQSYVNREYSETETEKEKEKKRQKTPTLPGGTIFGSKAHGWALPSPSPTISRKAGSTFKDDAKVVCLCELNGVGLCCMFMFRL